MPETGSLAKSGIEKVKGIRLAADDFQKERGVKVELLIYDDESNPLKAVASVEKLAGVEKVNAIVGGFGSNLVGPASEAAERYDTPYLTTGAVDTKLSAKRFRNFFRLNSMPGYAAAQAGAIRELFGAKRVAVLYNSQSATSEIADALKGQLEAAGIAVPVYEKYEKGTTNYKPLLLKVRDAHCEVIVVQGYHVDYVATIKDASILGTPAKAYVGPWGIGTPEFKQALGPLSESVFGTGNWEIGTAPKAAQAEEAAIVAAYRARYGEAPSSLSMLAYLGTRYMLDAIQRGGGEAGAYGAERTRAALRALDVTGPLGRVAFDDKGDPKYFTTVLFQIQDGKQVVVYPRDRATGTLRYPAVPWSANQGG
jgi:branched-chain amino acid transport system substrate-binding protein